MRDQDHDWRDPQPTHALRSQGFWKGLPITRCAPPLPRDTPGEAPAPSTKSTSATPPCTARTTECALLRGVKRLKSSDERKRASYRTGKEEASRAHDFLETTARSLPGACHRLHSTSHTRVRYEGTGNGRRNERNTPSDSLTPSARCMLPTTLLFEACRTPMDTPLPAHPSHPLSSSRDTSTVWRAHFALSVAEIVVLHQRVR